jgi:hypothetical protein
VGISDEAEAELIIGPFDTRASELLSREKPHAQQGELHLNSVPNEATTSIWLKAMMVRTI